MPRKDDAPLLQGQDPEVSEDAQPRRPAESAPEAWLENPRNIQAFFEAIERARKAKSRERPS